MTGQHQSDLYCQLRRYGLHVDFIERTFFISNFDKFLIDNSWSVANNAVNNNKAFSNVFNKKMKLCTSSS
jgi:hypothetical protein